MLRRPVQALSDEAYDLQFLCSQVCGGGRVTLAGGLAGGSQLLPRVPHPASQRADLHGAPAGLRSGLTSPHPTPPIVHILVNYRREDEGADDLDSVFTALASRHRRQIVDLLALQPASIQQLARRIGISLTAIHRHIRVLEDANLIRRKKSGRVNFLAINRATMRPRAGLGPAMARVLGHQTRRPWTTTSRPSNVQQHPATAPGSEEGKSMKKFLFLVQGFRHAYTRDRAILDGVVQPASETAWPTAETR